MDPSETIRALPHGALDASELPMVPLDLEESTMAVPCRELDQAKTADIAPALLPGSSGAPVKPPSGRALKGWLGLAGGVLVAGGIAAYWFLSSAPTRTPGHDSDNQTSARTSPEAVPPELRSYMDQAQRGDAKAMHMLALMYWNGLNIKQDRVKGLSWYRKAAAAGDLAAQKELSIIEAK